MVRMVKTGLMEIIKLTNCASTPSRKFVKAYKVC